MKAKVEEFRDDPASMLSDDDDDNPDVDVDEAEVRRIDEAKRVLKFVSRTFSVWNNLTD